MPLPLSPPYPSFNTPLFFLFFFFPCFLGLPNPNAAAVQPIFPDSSPPSTIPAFPEQSHVAGCSLNLSDDLFHGVKSACASSKEGLGAGGDLHRSRCCPVLAAWLYSAYSATALSSPTLTTSSYETPLLPDDPQTCVNGLGKALKARGIELIQPNETCDVVYCYCRIRLHPFTCPEAFSVSRNGKLVGNKKVRRLERTCLSSSTNVNKFPGLGGCSKCLNTLYSVSSSASLISCSLLVCCRFEFDGCYWKMKRKWNQWASSSSSWSLVIGKVILCFPSFAGDASFLSFGAILTRLKRSNSTICFPENWLSQLDKFSRNHSLTGKLVKNT